MINNRSESAKQRWARYHAAQANTQTVSDNSSNNLKDDDVLILGLSLGLILVLVLGLGFVLGLILILVLGLSLVLVLVLGLSLSLGEDRNITLFVVFYVIGVIIGGVIGYQQTQIQSLSANAITTTIQPSTYQGIVEAIYTNSPSYITFTSGQNWYGNVSKVENLSIGSVCTLIQNASHAVSFISGKCRGS